MADQQEIIAARERVTALRRQVRAEQNDLAVAAAEAARDSQLAALTDEERSLERQLAEVRATNRPGEVTEMVVPAVGTENVNVLGGPVRIEQAVPAIGEPPAGGFMEVVDRAGNLVRVPINVESTVDSVPAPPANVEGSNADAVPAVPAPTGETVPADGGTVSTDATVELTPEGEAAGEPPATEAPVDPAVVTADRPLAEEVAAAVDSGSFAVETPVEAQAEPTAEDAPTEAPDTAPTTRSAKRR